MKFEKRIHTHQIILSFSPGRLDSHTRWFEDLTWEVTGVGGGEPLKSIKWESDTVRFWFDHVQIRGGETGKGHLLGVYFCAFITAATVGVERRVKESRSIIENTKNITVEQVRPFSSHLSSVEPNCCILHNH